MARKASAGPPKRKAASSRRRKGGGRTDPKPEPRAPDENAGQEAGRRDPAEAAPPTPSNQFPVVGVGASAGGLEAFSQLLRSLPTDTGMAFVLVQHLAAHHESILPSILARETRMPVREAQEGMRVEPNHVYVIPSNQDMVIKDGYLALQARTATEGRHMPVDLFLRTLAEVKGSQAVAVVMSGTGSDGTLGCKAVKAAGGISFAQEPESARYDGMPRSAIAAGCIDLVLPPEAIAHEIRRLSGNEYLRPYPEKEAPPPSEVEKDPFQRILAMLKRRTDTDFRCYKKPTLLRRIRRRMALWKLDSLGEYVRWLHENPGEIERLHQDLLINVTTFFRDSAAFDTLANELAPRILKDRPADAPVRIWVPGCATGEEAYSIAICLLEAISGAGATPSILVFGTDLSSKAIEKARAGVYLENIIADVSPERLARFFVKLDGNYQINKPVRDLCVFAQHDLIRDPPFSRLDLVSCRNVLIYLEATHQKRLLASFHYALKPGGFLILGPSETVGSSELFDPIDKEHRVYGKKGAAAPASLPLVGRYAGPGGGARPPAIIHDAGRLHVQREVDRILLERYGPPGVLVDDNLDILLFRGDTSAYLDHPHGEASLSLMRMLRKGPLVEVRQAIQEARAKDRPARREIPSRRQPGSNSRVTVEAVPVRGTEAGQSRCFLVLFEEAPPHAARPPAPTPGEPESAKKDRVAELEQELGATKHYQQALLEEQEAFNEELQSAHEEVLSSNEELQSINEELETAKEELQSSNEELTTVNEELQNRNQELSQATDDMINLLDSLSIPIVMLGPDLRLRRFTPAAARVFNLLPGDVGRPIGDLRGSLDVAGLGAMVRETVDSVTVKSREVADQEGHWHLLRVHPYRTKDNRVDGAVLLLIDIDELKKGAERLEQARAYAEAIVDTVGRPVLILDHRLRVEPANRTYYELFRTTPAQTEGRVFYELDAPWDVTDLRRRLDNLPPRGDVMEQFRLTAEFPGLGRRTMVVSASRLSLGEPAPTRILLAIDDRTEEVRMAEDREHLLVQEESAARQAESASRLKDEFIATVSHELRGPLNAMAGWVHVLGSGRPDPATLSRGIGALERAVKTQTRLIEDLLDMSRIMAGKLRLAHRFIDLLEVVRAAIDTSAPAAEAKSIRVELRTENVPLFVLGDPDRLQQVVWNLLSNAIKFTPREGRVAVDVRRQDTSVQLRVSDTGQGISPDFLPHIFEPFRQADSSPARSQQGLGLGLAISRHLVESHGGLIRAESGGNGRGTAMTVLLPVPPLTGDLASGPGEGPASRPAADPSLLGGLRVMVVEDEEDSREMIATVLREWGAEVLTVASADDALKAVEDGRFDVIVSDIGLPGRDGYELIRLLRERGRLAPAVALTAYAEEESRNKALQAGFQEHVSKPADPQDLLQSVARLAGRRRSPPA